MSIFDPHPLEKQIASRFVCAKCKSQTVNVKSVAMTGTGLSRLFDLQRNKYVFASCAHCGYTEVYDRNTLGAGGMDVLDMLFGH